MSEPIPYKEVGVLQRHPSNPLLTAEDVGYPCSLLFNAGIAKHRGRYVMVFRNDYGAKNRVESAERKAKKQGCFDGTNIGIALSDDGVTCFVGATSYWSAQLDMGLSCCAMEK